MQNGCLSIAAMYLGATFALRSGSRRQRQAAGCYFLGLGGKGGGPLPSQLLVCLVFSAHPLHPVYSAGI